MKKHHIDPLSRLAVHHGTDKFGKHDYTPHYHRLLGHLADSPIRMLEIGVGGYADRLAGGASLAVWRDYFPGGHIVGLDIAGKRLDLGPRVAIEKGSQTDAEFLAKLVARHGPFDVIIDDGSHQNSDVLETYRLLFKTLKPDGFYIVEDVQTAFLRRFGGSLELTAPNSVGHFSALCNAMVLNGQEPAHQIAEITRVHNMVALRKGGAAALTIQPVRAHLKAGDLSPAASDWSLLPAGALVAVDPESITEGWLRDRFAEVDHREIAIEYPDAKPSPLARQIVRIVARPGALFIEKGRNDYPSNLAFDPLQEDAAAALEAASAILSEGVTEAGLCYYGSLFASCGKQEEARRIADRLEARGIETAGGFEFVWRITLMSGQHERARALLTEANTTFPGHAVFATQLALNLLRDGDLDSAERTLQRARSEGGNTPALAARFAMLNLQRGQIEAALEEARYATQTNPRAAAGWAALARVQMAQGRYGAAEKTLLDALERCPQKTVLEVALDDCRRASSGRANGREK